MGQTAQNIILGIIQGLTEFLPVSSSAHLVIAQDFFQIKENQILLDIVLHLGTLLALIVFLFKDILRLLNIRIASYILLATALTAAVVILGKEFFESMFLSAGSVALPLFITGIILLAAQRFGKGRRSFSDLKLKDGFWLGIVQGLAVIPGLSRSGTTISALLFRGIEREAAFKFSFLASIPVILGALVFKLNEFSQVNLGELRYMSFGFGAAFLSGLLALKILLGIIRRGRWHLFGYYCLALSLVLLLIL
jgi:undecaprenyl-diphosphatase